MSVQNAAKVVNGVITNVIVVDISKEFSYAGVGYVLADNNVSTGWVQQSDGFVPPSSGLTVVTTSPSIPVSISTSYAAKLATNEAAMVTARSTYTSSYNSAITAGQTIQQAKATAIAASNAAYTAAGGT